MAFLRFLVFLFLFTVTYCQETHNPDIGSEPLIIRYPEDNEPQCIDEEQQLKCTSWRFAVEANNLSPWKTIPKECDAYVKEYMLGKGYRIDLEMVSKEAGAFAASHELIADGRDIWVFDVDETLLSNLPYYSKHGFGNPEDQVQLATIFKSEKRREMMEEGYRIVGNSGDQWSDLLGSSMSIRSFKLPNPMYYLP